MKNNYTLISINPNKGNYVTLLTKEMQNLIFSNYNISKIIILGVNKDKDISKQLYTNIKDKLPSGLNITITQECISSSSVYEIAKEIKNIIEREKNSVLVDISFGLRKLNIAAYLSAQFTGTKVVLMDKEKIEKNMFKPVDILPSIPIPPLPKAKEKILQVLINKKCTLDEIRNQLSRDDKTISKSAIVQHLNYLRDKGIIMSESIENKKYYEITEIGFLYH